ncbi:hypothetical protein BGZ51_000995 [Haplosporangium sp. Z 767]|nr:hypothetical protein BGZ51_000995 [Haplosporangium sp. Z 767]KAF9190003.1 hypothetical protein BGZ50_000467 [Haplosporangium sp. Z 11]
MEHSTPVYYEDHRNDYDQLVPIDEDEEYREDLFLKHYNRPRLGGLGLIHDDDDDSETGDDYSDHHNRANYQDDDDGDEELDDDDDYDELDMDQHGIHLLSGSLSVRSPFLDAIREEEGEEAVFTKPSSYPSLGSGRYLNRLSGEGVGSWAKRSSLGMAIAEKQRLQQQQEASDRQQSNFNNTNHNDGSKPRGPRPQIVPGRPRSNTSSLTKVTTGFDISPSSTFAQGQDASEKAKKDEHALRQSQASPESTMQDLEVKRVLEGATALTSSSASSLRGEINNSAESTPLPSTASVNPNAHTISLSSSARDGNATSPGGQDYVVSFGNDTQKSIDDFFGMVKSDLDKRIQEAIQEVEQKFLDRVQRLEKHTAALAGVPPEAALLPESAGTSDGPKPGSLMESLTRPLPAHQNPGGSIALRKEILSHVTEKVGDLDLRVNQMEVLVSYKLVDIESKVQDLHGAHNSIAQKVHQVAKSHKSNMQGIRAGDGVGQNTIDTEEARISAAMQPYRDIDAHGNGASAFLEPIDDDDEGEGIVSLRAPSGGKASTDLVDASSAIVELRTELQDLGMRYQELNDGLLTDLMGQMRDAKLMLFQTVDEVDSRISKRVDRIEAEMHSKLLSEIEGRVQERVRAMEQTSSRLEKCFDKMEGRLGALETVLASRRPRPESMYQLLQQQIQQQQQQDEENGVSPHAGTFAGFPSSPSSGYRSVTSMLFSEADSKPSETATQYTRPRRRTLAENGIYPDNTQLSRQDSYDGPLMMLETDSMHSTLKSSSPPSSKSHSSYDRSAMVMVASPLEGFVTPAQARPVWSPSRGVPTTAVSSTSASTTSMVSSPLERGTVIGDRMGTIHQEYTPRTSYVPSTPTKDKFSSGSSMASSGKESDGQGSTGQGSRIRRVSLSSFDANSLSALKPVRPSTTAAAAEKSTSTSIVTTMTTMTTMTTQHSGDNDSHGNISVKSSSSSLLTAKLNGSNGSGSSSSATKTMQRAMTFDTLHSQASAVSTITKTVKAPVQGPSSYREILHFWKAGGSGNSSSKSAAV